MTVEVGEAKGLPEGWQWPEPAMVKAADGKTDIYTVIFRPSDFSPERSYPVIDYTYGSEYVPIGSFQNNAMRTWLYLTGAALAELGFIVVMVNSRGSGLRHYSKILTMTRSSDRLLQSFVNMTD